MKQNRNKQLCLEFLEGGRVITIATHGTVENRKSQAKALDCIFYGSMSAIGFIVCPPFCLDVLYGTPF